VFACAASADNRYGFHCPTCAKWTLKDAGPATVTLLLRAGAVVVTWPPPDDPALGPITAAELFEFREQLEGLPTAERET
jgi:hypothetical protein